MTLQLPNTKETLQLVEFVKMASLTEIVELTNDKYCPKWFSPDIFRTDKFEAY